jgi:hypothetical protein
MNKDKKEKEGSTLPRTGPAKLDWQEVRMRRWRTAVGLGLLCALICVALVAAFVGDAEFDRVVELIREAVRSVALIAAGAGYRSSRG